MAEIGIIASGMGIASLAIQITDSILKLKGFLDSVKEAPEEIKHLIEEVDILTVVLSEIDPGIQNGESELDSPSMRKCWEHCSQGLDILEAIVRDLDRDIGRGRRIGSFKVVLKKGLIERLKNRLKSAQLMLLMAHQIYSATLQKKNSIFHRQWADAQQKQLLELRTGVFQTREVMVSIQESIASSQPTSRISDPDGEDDEGNKSSTRAPLCLKHASARGHRRIGSVAKSRGCFMLRVRAPFWSKVTTRALELSAQRAPFGWDFSFETYNIVENDAPIMEYTKTGNITAIQELFSKQEAAPNDRTRDGMTVLGNAVWYGQLEVCRLLRQQGADAHCMNSYGFDKASVVSQVLAGLYQRKGAQHQLDLARLLSDGIDLEVESLDQRGIFRGDSTLVSWLRSETNFGYSQRDLRSRVCFTTRICSIASQPYVESLMRELLGNYATDSTACAISDKSGRTLLHCVLWHLGEQYHASSEEYNSLASDKSKGNYFSSPHPCKSSVLKSLVTFVSELVVAGSDLHGCASRWGARKPLETPLTAIFFGFAHGVHLFYVRFPFLYLPDEKIVPESNPQKVQVVVLLWLRVLERAGVDLEEYGRKEKLVYQKGLVENFYSFALADEEKLRYSIMASTTSTLYSLTFIYGPTPSDWKFWFIEQMDNKLLEFWDMVDHPERAMPGYWDERFDEEYEEI